jgi:hypothetical protein
LADTAAGTARSRAALAPAWQLRPLCGALALDAAVVVAAWLLPASSWPARLSWPFRLTHSPSGGHAALTALAGAHASAGPAGSMGLADPAGSAGLTGPAGLAALAALAASTKLLAAAALLGIALGRPGWSTRDRLAVGALGATLPVLATAPWSGWPAALPGLLAPLPSPALRWFAAYGTLLAAALLLALLAAAALRRHSLAAAVALDWALALLLTAAALAALGFARRPAIAAAALASLSASALLVGAALAAFHPPGRAGLATPRAGRRPPDDLGERPASHPREPAAPRDGEREIGEAGAAAGEAS